MMKISIISMAVKMYIAKIGLDDISSDISSVAEYLKISESGVFVDPEFWIGRFHRKGKNEHILLDTANQRSGLLWICCAL